MKGNKFLVVNETKNVVFPPPGYEPLKFMLRIPVLESEYYKDHKLSETWLINKVQLKYLWLF